MKIKKTQFVRYMKEFIKSRIKTTILNRKLNINMDGDEVDADLKYPYELNDDIKKFRDKYGCFRYNRDTDCSNLWYRSKIKRKVGYYTGQVFPHSSNPHGKGYLIYDQDGSLFEGYWEKGSMVFGRIIRPTGTMYIGQFRDNKMNGKGTLTKSNGTVYKGRFKKNQLHGKIECRSTDGTKYTCIYNDGEEKDDTRTIIKNKDDKSKNKDDKSKNKNDKSKIKDDKNKYKDKNNRRDRSNQKAKKRADSDLKKTKKLDSF